MNSETNPYELARSAANALRALCGVDNFDSAVVLGSGWREAAEAVGTALGEVATSDLPGFLLPTVPGHHGRIFAVRVGDKTVAMISGRVHLYEGHSAAEVVHPIRTAIVAGATSVVLTNAAGSLDKNIGPGQTVLISDHLNFTSTSPLEGPAAPEGFAGRFVDLSDLYDRGQRAAVRALVPELPEGVYAGLRGPHYETPAEIAMLRTLGATTVGMSTVLEAIAARHLGAKVTGLSLATNYAAGVTDEPLDHEEVLAAGRDAASTLTTLLATILPVL